MAIRFGNLGLEGLNIIEGVPEGKGSVTLVVDAPAGKGVFLSNQVALTPVDSARTLKTYVIPIESPEPATEKGGSCGGAEWVYTINFRSRVKGKWKSLRAYLAIHICPQRRSVEVIGVDGDVLLAWELHRRNRPSKSAIPESLLN